MPHRQFSSPSVRPTHSCRTPATPPVCPHIRAASLSPVCTVHSCHTPATPATPLARPFVCTASCPPPRLHRFPCLRGLPHHIAYSRSPLVRPLICTTRPPTRLHRRPRLRSHPRTTCLFTPSACRRRPFPCPPTLPSPPAAPPPQPAHGIPANITQPTPFRRK